MNVIYTDSLQAENDLIDLYKILGWNDFLMLSPNQLITAMKQSFFVIYAYVGNRLVGTGRVVSDGIINAYICGVGVLPMYRRQGIGTEIIKKLASHCTESNLHIQFFCDESMIAYYEKIGFERFAIGMK